MSSSLMMNEEEERRTIRYLKSFPLGFQFVPTDEELIEEYLKKKLQNAPLPINLIKDVHLYDHIPWELTENSTSYGGNEYYFFTPRDRKYAIGARAKRVTRIRYWKSYGQVIPIYDSTGVEIGSKKVLVFYEGKQPNGNKTPWVMHEYKAKDEDAERTTNGTTANVRASSTVVTRSRSDMQLDEWVLCKIYKKKAEEEPAAATPPPSASAASATLTAAAENRLNIIENTATRVENTATGERNTSREQYLGNDVYYYDPHTFCAWRLNKSIGKLFKKAEEPAAPSAEPAATPAAPPSAAPPAATPSAPPAATPVAAPAATKNHLNIIENTVTRVEDTAIREGNTERYIYIGTSDISYDPHTFLLWRSNKCLGKVFKRAEEEPAATPPASPIEYKEERNDDEAMFNIDEYLSIPADTDSPELLGP